jgi:hypothetical protein
MDSNYVWAIFAFISLVIILGSIFLALTGRLEMIDDSVTEGEK